MKILYVGEIVGKAGIWCVKNALPALRQSEKPDLVIASGDGATGNAGLGRQHAGYLRKMGIDALVGGDCTFYKKDLVEGLDTMPYVIRPANLSPESPGRGWRFINVGKEKVAVVSLLGRAGFSRIHADNPFALLPQLADRLRQETPYIIVDFHAAATAEKQALFFLADGKVSAVIGSHGRVATADETILPNGTGVITDAGRTGSLDSVGGTDSAVKIREYLTRIPEWTKDAWDKPALQGIILEVDRTGKTTSIRRISRPCADPPREDAVPAQEE